MPLTLEQQNELLLKNGFNPAEHYLDENTGDVFKRKVTATPVQPVTPPVTPSFDPQTSQILTSQESQKPTMSKSEALGVSAGSAIAPTAIALGVGRLLNKIPIPNPWAKMAVTGLGAAVAGVGGSIGQEMVLPEAANQKIQQATEEHPYVSGLGRFLPSLPTLSVGKSLSEIKDLGGALKNLVARGAASGDKLLSPTEKMLLGQSAFNIGLSGGMEGVAQYRRDTPFDPVEFGINALLPGLIAHPNKLGMRIAGVKGDVTPGPAEENIVIPKAEKKAQTAVDITDAVPLDKNVVVSKSKKSENINFQHNEAKVGDIFLHEEKPYQVVNVNETLVDGTPRRKVTAKPIKEVIPDGVQEQKAEGMQVSEDVQNILKSASEGGIPMTWTKNLEAVAAKEGFEVKGDTTPNSFVEHLQKKYAAPETPPVRKSPESALTEEEIALISKKIRDDIELTPKEKLFLREQNYQMTLPFYERKAQERGWSIKEDPNLQQAGQVTTDPADNTLTVGQQGKRGAGTVWHEGWHKYLQQLLKSGDARDAKQMQELAKIMGIDPEKVFNAPENPAEEPGAIVAEKEGFDRAVQALYGKKRERFAKWLSDVKENIKYRFGKDLTPEEAAKVLERRMYYDAPGTSPFDKTYEAAGVTRPGNIEGLAEEADKREAYRRSGESQVDDLSRYNQIQARMKELIKEDKYGDPEFKELWKQNEEIKNRHGGMPPKKEVKTLPMGEMFESNNRAIMEKHPQYTTPAKSVEELVSRIARENKVDLRTVKKWSLHEVPYDSPEFHERLRAIQNYNEKRNDPNLSGRWSTKEDVATGVEERNTKVYNKAYQIARSILKKRGMLPGADNPITIEPPEVVDYVMQQLDQEGLKDTEYNRQRFPDALDQGYRSRKHSHSEKFDSFLDINIFRYVDRYIAKRQREYARVEGQLTTLEKTGAVSGEQLERAEIATPAKEVPMAEAPKQKLSEKAIMEMSDEEVGHLVDDSYDTATAEFAGQRIKEGFTKGDKNIIDGFLRMAESREWDVSGFEIAAPKQKIASSLPPKQQSAIEDYVNAMRQKYEDPEYVNEEGSHIDDELEFLAKELRSAKLTKEQIRAIEYHAGDGEPDVAKAMEAALAAAPEETPKTNKRKSEESQVDDTKFLVNSSKALLEEPLKLNPDREGKYNAQLLFSELGRRGVMGSLERKIYEDAGFKTAFPYGKKATREEIAKWMEENGPQVKIVEYGMEGKVSEAKREYDKMTHDWLENLQYGEQSKFNDLLRKYYNVTDSSIKNIFNDPEDFIKARRYADLKDIVDKEDPTHRGPRATSYYNQVSALPADEPMPDWTSTKGNKNVQRVDVVLPQKVIKGYPPEKRGGVQYVGIPDKVETLWQQDNLHENLPNTLGWAMLQYKTGPNGEKIALIAEAQSRWGQKYRERPQYKSIEDLPKDWTIEQEPSNVYGEPIYIIKDAEGNNQGSGYTKELALRNLNTTNEFEVKPHPLLEDYNRLILKAAISQAKKEGATHIMVSDAETAMMTEMHDQQTAKKVKYLTSAEAVEHVGKQIPDYGQPNSRDFLLAKRAFMEDAFGQDYRDGKFASVDGTLVRYDKPEANQFKAVIDIAKQVQELPPNQSGIINQAKGMRQNYDKSLPDIAEGLTGQKGEKISLGEHKNAYGDIRGEVANNKVRDNLIFKNPDGTPKTDISGRIYPIGDVPDRAPKQYGSRYSKESAPLDEGTILRKNQLIKEALRNDKFHGILYSRKDPLTSIIPNAIEDIKSLYYDLRAREESLARGETDTVNTIKHFTEEDLNALNSFLATKGQIIRNLPSNFEKELYWVIKDPNGNYVKDNIETFYGNDKYPERIKIFDTVTRKYDSALGVLDAIRKNRKEDISGYTVEPVFVKIFNRTAREKTLEGYPIMANIQGEASYRKFNNDLDFIRSETDIEAWNRAQENGEIDSDADAPFDVTASVKDSSNIVPLRNLGKRYSGESALDEGTVLRKIYKNPSLRLMEPELQKVANLKHPNALEVADAISRTYLKNTFYQGRVADTLQRPIQELNMTDDQLKRWGNYMFKRFWKVPGWDTMSLDSKQRRATELFDKGIKELADLYTEKGIKIHRGDDYRDIVKRPNYWPQMISEEGAKALGDKDPLAMKLLREHYMEQDPDLSVTDAQKLVDEYAKGLTFRGRDLTTNLDFKPLKRAQGLGLPYKLVEKDPLRMMHRYAGRVGAGLSFHENITANPRVRYALGMKDEFGRPAEAVEGVADITTHKEVYQAMKSLLGYSDYNEHPNLAAGIRLVQNLVLGTPTAVRNLAQIPQSAMPYISSITDVSKALGKLLDYKQLAARAYKSGTTRESYRGFDARESEFDLGPDNAWQKFAMKSADWLRKYSGRDLSDKIEGEMFHALGETLAEKEIAAGKAGDFLQKFSTGIDRSKLKNVKSLTPEDIQLIAKEFVDTVRGSYDARTLPTLAMRGQIAPFLSLSRWSIAKANTQLRDIVGPMKKGNWMPFLKTFIAALGTGYGIEQLNDVLSGGKKREDASVKEVLASGRQADYAEKVLDLLQLAGFMGIVSDSTKLMFRATQGKDLAYSNPLSFPAYTLLTDTLIKNTGQLISAIKDGEDPFKALEKYAVLVTSGMSQNARTVRNMLQTDETERKNMFRDYRVWQRLSGNAPEGITGAPNEFQDMGVKEFKRTKDLGKAAGMVGDLVSKTIEESKGNPEILKKKLTSLKQNSYQTMPDFENYPMSFFEYYTHLAKTQGDQAAQDRLVDFITTREINKAKNSMVPSLKLE